MCANFTEWLDGAMAEQEALPLTSPPAFLSSAVTAKLDPIETEVRRLIKKPKPKPKPKPKANATDTNGTATPPPNATASDSTASDSTASDSTPPEPKADADAKPADDEEMPAHDEL